MSYTSILAEQGILSEPVSTFPADREFAGKIPKFRRFMRFLRDLTS